MSKQGGGEVGGKGWTLLVKVFIAALSIPDLLGQWIKVAKCNSAFLVHQNSVLRICRLEHAM